MEEDEQQRYMSCLTCKVSEPITEDYDFGNWISRHPLHSCSMGTAPRGQSSLF